MLENILKEIGLSDKEIKVYLASLKMGSQPVSTIAKTSHINRTTVYVILKKLLEKGLMTKFHKGDVLYFTPSSPETLKVYLERKKKELEVAGDNLETALPEFEKMMEYAPTQSKIRYFEGIDGIKALYDQTLKEDQPIDEYLFHYDGDLPVMWDFWDVYIKRRLEQKIPLRLIAAEDKISVWAKRNDQALNRTTRILPAEKFPHSQNMVIIFGDYYGYISYADGQYSGALIQDKKLAETQRAIFQIIWDSAEEYDAEVTKRYELDKLDPTDEKPVNR